MLALCLIGLALSAPLYAQFDAATILGTVRDASGAVVANADVTLHNEDLATDLHRKTNSSGDYEFPDVQIGNYSVTVQAAGFSESTTATFNLTVADRRRIDVPLQVSSVTETVKVVAENSSNLQTDSSDRSTVITGAEITNLPLNGREYADLSLLAPGVHVGSLEDGSVQQRRGSFIVNGNPSTSNNFLLDGLDNNSYQLSNQGYNNQSVPEQVDAVAEYRVITNNYAAEYGRAGGAIVNVSTKSGTDELHGSLFEYVRNTAFDAYGPFYETGVKPTLVQNQFGGSLGGPVPFVRRLFFFGDYEGLRQVTHTYNTPTLPTADQRNGIFYEVDANGNEIPVPLQNPFTGALYSDGKIDMSLETPFAKQVLSALPLPNLPGFSSNYAWTPRGTQFRDIGDLRLDDEFSDRLHGFLRVSKQSAHIMVGAPVPGPSGGSGDGHVRTLTTAVAGGVTYTVTPNSVLDARFGLVFTESGKLPYNYGLTSIYTQLGIPYPIDPSLGTVSLNSQAARGFNAFGPDTTINQFTNPHTLNPKVNYTLVKGKHSYSFGYEYMWLNEDASLNNPGYGSDTYTGNFSTLKPEPANLAARGEAYGLADFIYGARSKYELSTHAVSPEYWDFQYAYVEDSWRVFRNLTLNYGLRYEFSTPERTKNNHLANFDPASNSLILASPGSIYNESIVHPRYTDWAPRVGFAYSFYPNIVFRGGYGISYIQFSRYGANGDPSFNGPYAIDSVVSQTPTQPLCANNSSDLTCFRNTMQGYPLSMVSPAVYSTAVSEVSYVPANNRPGYVQSYMLGTQVQLASSTVLDIAFVGNHGLHLRVETDYNQASLLPTASSTASLQSRRPISNFTDIIDNAPLGSLNYNSLQVNLRRPIRSLFLINSFTWSKAFDNASSTDNANGDTQFVNKYCVRCDRGISGYDQRLNESLALMWRIPYGSSIHNRILRQGLSEWTTTTIMRLTSGLPMNLTYDPVAGAVDTDLGYGYRPNVTGPLYTVMNPRSQWVKTDAYYGNVFNTVQLGTPAANVLYGNSPRNGIVGPSYANVDFGLQKIFSLPAKVRLQFRAEAFNLFNHTNLKSPGTDMSNAGFGEFTSARADVFPSRQLQFAIRLTR